jgi:hypothetical protein
VSAGSVTLDINGQVFTLEDAPYQVSIGDMASDDVQLVADDLTVSATAYSGPGGTGATLDQRDIELQAINGLTADGAVIPSEFDQTGEAEGETEAETEVEAEAVGGAAGAAVGTGATAAAVGSNALTHTLSSGSISVKGQPGDTAPNLDVVPTGNTASIEPGQGSLANSGSTPNTVASVSVEEAEAEAEVEVEAEAEAEVSDTSAAAAAGVSGAAAAVGSSLVDGNIQLSDVHTAIDGASATSTSTAANPNGSRSTEAPGVVQTAPEAVERSNSVTHDVFGEAEVEVETEAEAEVGKGTAAAAAAGGAGVAVAGNYAVADAATTSGVGTSASDQTNNAADVLAFLARGTGMADETLLTGSATVDDVVIENDSPGAVESPPDQPGITSTAEAEVEAGAEAEVEAEAGNNAAAIALVASAGAGTAGVGSDAIASSSVSGSTSTLGHAGSLTINNDLTQIEATLTSSDPAATEV